MKKRLMRGIAVLMICMLALTGCTLFGRDAGSGGDTSAKPVIYIYPEETTEVRVKLDFNGTLTCTYPVYEDGWTVTSEPDGTLTDNAVLTVSPEPDTVIRVYMAWKGLDEPVEIEAQEFSAVERIGFTLVEWGGCEVR